MSLVFIIAETGPYWLDGEVNVRYRAEIAMTGCGRKPTLAEHIQIGLPLNSGLHRAASDVRLKPDG